MNTPQQRIYDFFEVPKMYLYKYINLNNGGTSFQKEMILTRKQANELHFDLGVIIYPEKMELERIEEKENEIIIYFNGGKYIESYKEI